MSGFDVLETIRKNPKLDHFPLVVMSSVDVRHDEARSRHLGAHDFYVKPTDPDQMRKDAAEICCKWLQDTQKRSGK